MIKNIEIFDDLKLLFEMHVNLRLIKNDKEFEEYIDAILDKVSELEKELNKLNN